MCELFYGHRFGQIARFIDIGAARYGSVVGEQLQWQGVQNRREHARMIRQIDNVHAFFWLDEGIAVGKDIQLSCARFDLLQI